MSCAEFCSNQCVRSKISIEFKLRWKKKWVKRGHMRHFILFVKFFPSWWLLSRHDGFSSRSDDISSLQHKFFISSWDYFLSGILFPEKLKSHPGKMKCRIGERKCRTNEINIVSGRFYLFNIGTYDTDTKSHALQPSIPIIQWISFVFIHYH